MTEPIAAIVGTGLVGRAWAIAFARAGWQVRLWDPDPAAAGAALVTIGGLLADLAAQEMLHGAAAADVLGRIGAVADPGRRTGRCRLGAGERARGSGDQAGAVAGTSTVWPLPAPCSPAPPRRSAVQVHRTFGQPRPLLHLPPDHPPYLIPAVELVPAPWTSPETMARAEETVRGIGQAPIVMRRELDGFVMNRMQGALLEEAFRLVADGYCSIEDVDVGLKEGLALRWSFMGPFETIDLNAPGACATTPGATSRSTSACSRRCSAASTGAVR